ncbi:MAG: peptide-methionine (R)-S-oxide reductase MsrB [Hymenobacteraceae bacterium]|nr:peptide-methionine (R)-S-oxide reductase MsrB [Hymenobacteraceae bacterium]
MTSLKSLLLTPIFGSLLLVSAAACGQTGSSTTEYRPSLVKTEAQWKAQLTPEQYHVLREKGTERAFTGAFVDNHADGTYYCAACHQKLFAASSKFESGTGWPSFWAPADKKAVAENVDSMYGMKRTEVVCGRCGGHLGHVFEDGPKPTGLRYCLNSVSLAFEPSTPAGHTNAKPTRKDGK